MSSPRVGDFLFWQHYYRADMAEAELLESLRRRYKPGAARDALWSGAYALREKAMGSVYHARNRGVLLTMFTEDQP